MEVGFSTVAQRVDASWWPAEIRQALVRGSVSEWAQHWCLEWWRGLVSGLEESPRPGSSLERWAQSDNKLFFQVAESLGLCVFRDPIRRIIDKKSLEELRLVLGARRLNTLVTEFPSVKLLEPPVLPAQLSAPFLRMCTVIGLQLGLTCARAIASPAQPVFGVSLPLHGEQEGVWKTDDEYQSVWRALDFLMQRSVAGV